jgi:hypothetical protein
MISRDRDEPEERQVTSKTPIAVVGVSALFPGSLDEPPASGATSSPGATCSPRCPGEPLAHRATTTTPTRPRRTRPTPSAAASCPIDFDPLASACRRQHPAGHRHLAAAGADRRPGGAGGRRGGDFAHMDRSAHQRDPRRHLGARSCGARWCRAASRSQMWVKALRDGGHPRGRGARSLCAHRRHYVPWQESSFPGLLGNVVAGRIANRLDLGGTNCVTDAACASSLSGAGDGGQRAATWPQSIW